MQKLKAGIKILFSLGLLSYLIYISDPLKILSVMRNVYSSDGLYNLFFAFAMLFLSIGLLAKRWGIILKHYGVQVPFKKLYSFYLIGLFFNNFLPTGIGGDIARIYQLAQAANDRTHAFASVIIERLLGISATLIIAISSLFWVADHFKDDRILYISLFMFLFIFGFFVLVTRKRPFEFLLKIFENLTLLRIGERLNKLIEAMHLLKGKRTLLIKAFLFSLFSQIAIIAMNFALARALHIEVDFSYLFLVVSVTFILTMLPSINGVGVRDGGYVFLLGKVGITSAAAVSLSSMNLIILMIVSVWGGILFLLNKNKVKNLEEMYENAH